MFVKLMKREPQGQLPLVCLFIRVTSCRGCQGVPEVERPRHLCLSITLSLLPSGVQGSGTMALPATWGPYCRISGDFSPLRLGVGELWPHLTSCSDSHWLLSPPRITFPTAGSRTQAGPAPTFYSWQMGPSCF